MYLPKHFACEDRAALADFLNTYSFGILLSQTQGELVSSHLAILFDEDLKYAYGHLAKANPQWKAWQETPSVDLIFHGPHAYISPQDYASPGHVPTWNYASVHAKGEIQIFDGVEEKVAVLKRLVEHYESSRDQPWSMSEELSAANGKINAIVCFRIKMVGIDFKKKLSQNQSSADRKQVVSNLRTRDGIWDSSVADMMDLCSIKSSPIEKDGSSPFPRSTKR
ncbi:MAG: transcriptional regulator [Planctomycetota bacterium]|nr:MAG: transcriptional regulator [Planctomycetota bacterium]